MRVLPGRRCGALRVCAPIAALWWLVAGCTTDFDRYSFSLTSDEAVTGVDGGEDAGPVVEDGDGDDDGDGDGDQTSDAYLDDESPSDAGDGDIADDGLLDASISTLACVADYCPSEVASASEPMDLCYANYELVRCLLLESDDPTVYCDVDAAVFDEDERCLVCLLDVCLSAGFDHSYFGLDGGAQP